MIRGLLLGFVGGFIWAVLRGRTSLPSPRPAQFSYLNPPAFYGNPDGSREITYGRHQTNSITWPTVIGPTITN